MNTTITQTPQIESVLVPKSVIESEISNESHIASQLGNLLVVEKVAKYKGSISQDDWEKVGKYWYYKVGHDVHNFSQPYVSKFLVASESGYDNALFSYTVFANKDVKFRSSYPVDCVYTITGE